MYTLASYSSNNYIYTLPIRRICSVEDPEAGKGSKTSSNGQNSSLNVEEANEVSRKPTDLW